MSAVTSNQVAEDLRRLYDQNGGMALAVAAGEIERLTADLSMRDRMLELSAKQRREADAEVLRMIARDKALREAVSHAVDLFTKVSAAYKVAGRNETAAAFDAATNALCAALGEIP